MPFLFVLYVVAYLDRINVGFAALQMQSQLGFSDKVYGLGAGMPYLVWNTVFDNTRATTELGKMPVPFSKYSFPLLEFSKENNFTYPYQPWPAAKAGGSAA